jgi:hypothetical protein
MELFLILKITACLLPKKPIFMHRCAGQGAGMGGNMKGTQIKTMSGITNNQSRK